jgi:EpsI family protein
MKKSLIVSLVLGVLMMSAGGFTKVLTPTVKLADQNVKIELVNMIPTSFGDWQPDTATVPLQADPEVQRRLDKLYNQTLSRTYVNKRGQRIMLSIAYGADQSDSVAMHKPEVCYAAQGFEIKNVVASELLTSVGNLPITRLLAVHGARTEPITYWITVGDKAIRPGLSQKVEQIRHGLSGKIPDGMLVRVSSIDANEAAAYGLQAGFIQDLLASISDTSRAKLVGTYGS